MRLPAAVLGLLPFAGCGSESVQDADQPPGLRVELSEAAQGDDPYRVVILGAEQLNILERYELAEDASAELRANFDGVRVRYRIENRSAADATYYGYASTPVDLFSRETTVGWKGEPGPSCTTGFAWHSLEPGGSFESSTWSSGLLFDPGLEQTGRIRIGVRLGTSPGKFSSVWSPPFRIVPEQASEL